jgi:hypothetical protein
VSKLIKEKGQNAKEISIHMNRKKQGETPAFYRDLVMDEDRDRFKQRKRRRGSSSSHSDDYELVGKF